MAHVGPEGAGGPAGPGSAQELRGGGAPALPRRRAALLRGPSNGGRRFYWIFPAGDHVRAGLATYTGDSALSQDLVDFLDRHDLGQPGHQHGGFFTSRMIDPIRDGMFVVGDAAGHCLPVSGEGIRPALVFGQLAGRLAERVRVGELTLDQALSRVPRVHPPRGHGYRFLDRLQSILTGCPTRSSPSSRATIGSRRVLPWAVDATGTWPTRTCSRLCPARSRSRSWPV